MYNKAYCSAAIFFDWSNLKNPKGINHATISGQIVNYNNLYDIYFYAIQMTETQKDIIENEKCNTLPLRTFIIKKIIKI